MDSDTMKISRRFALKGLMAGLPAGCSWGRQARDPTRRHAIYGSHHSWFRKSSGDQVSQTMMRPSITAPMDREDGTSSTPGDSRSATNSLSELASFADHL